MTLLHIGIFILAALLLELVAKGRWRHWFLLSASIIAVFWLQPFSPIRHLDFWMTCATLTLTVVTWVIVRSTSSVDKKETWLTAGIISVIVLLIGSLRYWDTLCCLTASTPPTLPMVLIAILLVTGTVWLLAKLAHRHKAWLWIGMIVILLIFVVLKTEPLGLWVSIGLRTLNRQPIKLASAADIRWLGFSYIAFRLLHVLRDRQLGKTDDFSLREFLTYVLFFPALSAGPIGRSQRFVQDLHKDFTLDEPGFLEAGRRLVMGILKKFILADSLALVALSEVNATQTLSLTWMWVLVYVYSFRIYFDFSGYTDIAIGIGQLFGIRLPENFDRPYLKPNLTVFWNSWHITLAQWFRAYFFYPLTRALRTSKRPVPLPVIILCGQLATMLLIGLWHGVTWNFVIWGIWHGLGLFIHNRWTEGLRTRAAFIEQRPKLKRWLNGAGILLTFHYVSLGWVWFALSTPEASWRVFLKLFGAGR